MLFANSTDVKKKEKKKLIPPKLICFKYYNIEQQNVKK